MYFQINTKEKHVFLPIVATTPLIYIRDSDYFRVMIAK